MAKQREDPEGLGNSERRRRWLMMIRERHLSRRDCGFLHTESSFCSRVEGGMLLAVVESTVGQAGRCPGIHRRVLDP